MAIGLVETSKPVLGRTMIDGPWEGFLHCWLLQLSIRLLNTNWLMYQHGVINVRCPPLCFRSHSLSSWNQIQFVLLHWPKNGLLILPVDGVAPPVISNAFHTCSTLIFDCLGWRARPPADRTSGKHESWYLNSTRFLIILECYALKHDLKQLWFRRT